MESKLLVGGKTILDKTTEQEKALEQRRKDILEQKVKHPYKTPNSNRFIILLLSQSVLNEYIWYL